MHPEAQRKAQAEIERVIGSDRFPTFADQPDLPYVDAFVKEVFRWGPVTPLGKPAVLRTREDHGSPSLRGANRGDSPGIPHIVTEDDVYEGYLIPKGSTVFANIW